MSSRLAVLLSTVLLASGCQVTSDLGVTCFLNKKQLKFEANGDPTYRKDKDGNVIKDKYGRPVQDYDVVNILERELTPGQDYISFGVPDCEDQICVRDADSPPNPDYDPKTTAPPEKQNAPALGYCTTPCVQGSSASACEVTDSSVASELKSRMDCRSLLLDQATLDKLRADDPATYQSTFGDTSSPFFCAGKPVAATGG
ncbi:MAG: adventurous gliding motility lipoprotein CglC [Hyalangium sp.]|uniref:adventurous gliding motility lipoprotein CglC n=1 Tax=Hyalangium sp. TaxID=2028555 RepID=UPI003899ED15